MNQSRRYFYIAYANNYATKFFPTNSVKALKCEHIPATSISNNNDNKYNYNTRFM